MACSPSIQALARACGSKGVVAGVEKLYIIAFADLAVPQGQATDEVYTESTNGLISAIGLQPSKSFVQVEYNPESVGLNETGTFDLKNGINYMTQTLTLSIPDLTADNRIFVKSVRNQPVAFILKTKTKNFYAAGLSGQLNLTGLEGGTGAAVGDTMGYNLTFTGIELDSLPLVDPTIIADLINP